MRAIALDALEQAAKIERHVEQPGGREAEVLRLNALEAAHEQPGTHQQHHAQCNLHANQQVLQDEPA